MKNCKICGIEISSNKSNKIYCSKVCYVESAKTKARECYRKHKETRRAKRKIFQRRVQDFLAKKSNLTLKESIIFSLEDFEISYAVEEIKTFIENKAPIIFANYLSTTARSAVRRELDLLCEKRIFAKIQTIRKKIYKNQEDLSIYKYVILSRANLLNFINL